MNAAPGIMRERRYGDLLVRFQYIRVNPHEIGSEHEPCLVLCRPERSGCRSAWAIPVDCAGKYVSDGEEAAPSRECLESAVKIAEMLNLSNDKATIARIVTVILDNLEHLLTMPPYVAPPQVVGEVDADFGGTRIRSELWN